MIMMKLNNMYNIQIGRQQVGDAALVIPVSGAGI
jgi:hypothetical protein